MGRVSVISHTIQIVAVESASELTSKSSDRFAMAHLDSVVLSRERISY